MGVAKGSRLLHKSSATLNVRKLVVHQIEAGDEHGLLKVPLVFLLDSRIYIGMWNFLIFVHNVSKIHRCQQHFNFELPSIELANDSSGLALK